MYESSVSLQYSHVLLAKFPCNVIGLLAVHLAKWEFKRRWRLFEASH